MRPPKYPLEPLVGLRDRKVDEAVGDLAEATKGRAAAEQRRRISETQRDAHAAAAERVRRDEAHALAEGGLRVADLAQAAAWEARIATERDTIASAVDSARLEEGRARTGEARALDAVGSCKAEARVVAKDRARWEGAQKRRAEGREEEAASEAWRPAKS